MKNPLEKISRFALKLLIPLTAQETYCLIVAEAVKLIEGEYGHIIMKEGKEFRRVYTSSPLPYQSPARQRANSYRAYKYREVLVVPAARTVKAHPELAEMGIKCAVLTPLSYKNESIGVLIITSKNAVTLNKHDITILKLFGSMASLAIRKAQLYEETKRSLEARDHFISMAAHELRTPLTSVSGYVQMLYSKLAGANTSESRWIEQLYQESHRLKNLVDELLEINRIRSGQFNYFLRECNLRDIIESVKKISRFSFPNREVMIDDRLGRATGIVIADCDKLMQVFTNLVENAARYSANSSLITIVLNKNNQEYIVLIKDQGIGIPKKEYGKIFEGYKQGSGHNKEGMGLGLYLVKNILAQFNGHIKVRSKVGKGTTMEVKLPKANL